MLSPRDSLYDPLAIYSKRMSLNLAHFVQHRQLSGGGYASLRKRIKQYTSSIYDEFPSNASAEGLEIGYSSLPLTCKYSNNFNSGQCLAVADEDGYLAIYDTKSPICDGPNSLRRAHENAIFDIEWTGDDKKIITASGDFSSIVWDVATMENVAIFRSHSGSVKGVSSLGSNNNIFVSSGRDGLILIFDTRCSTAFDEGIGLAVHKPVNVITNAHVPLDAIKGLKTPKKKINHAAKSFSVTSVKFLDSNRLLSSGSADGVVKLWDIRQNGFYSKTKFPASTDYSCPSKTNARTYGLTSLTLSPDNSTVFASCMDNHIYQFNINNLRLPINSFTAESYKCDSFFIRTSVSPDGRYLCSGSSDGSLHIWEVNLPFHPPLLMNGYEGEVTGVSWSSGDFDQLASCSDDRKVRIWRYTNELTRQYSKESGDAKNPFTVSEAALPQIPTHHHERHYSSSNAQENIAPNNIPSLETTLQSARKRPRRISDYFIPKSEP